MRHRTSSLPLLGRVACGGPIEVEPENERLAIPAHLLAGRSGEHFVLQVMGESMVEEGIHDGDLVVVRRCEEARPGEVVVALVGDEVTLKRYRPEGESVRLEPANRTMEPLRVAARDLRIQGVVVGLMRRY